YRVFTRYFNQDHLPGPGGTTGADGWHLLRGGFRSDSRLSAKDTLTLQGDVYTGESGNLVSTLPSITSPGPLLVEATIPLSGGFVQSTWGHTLSTRSDTKLQISFDRYKRDEQLTEARNTIDIDFQHHIAWGARQDIVWGANYRN